MLAFCIVCLLSSLVKPHAVQLVNVCVWVAPNAILLRHNCQWFEPFVIWTAFTSWTCWNTIFLIMLIEAHNCAPWDKGRAIARGGQSVFFLRVTCSLQTRSASCQAHMQRWVMLTSRLRNCINSYNMKGSRKQAVMTGCFLACCCLCMAVSHVMSVVLTRQSISHPAVHEKACLLRQTPLALKPHILPKIVTDCCLKQLCNDCRKAKS